MLRDYLVNAPLTASLFRSSFSALSDELSGKGKETEREGEKKIEKEKNGSKGVNVEGGEYIIVVADDRDDNDNGGGGCGRKRRATSIEHCLHSIEQIGSAALLVSRFHA